MSAEPERDPRAPEMDGDPFVRDQLAALDGDLMSRIPTDSRLESGVPDGQLSGALDFIQMTGLTRPPVRKSAPGSSGSLVPTAARDDMDPSAPLSFYEKGIADVDESMGAGGFGQSLRDAALDADLIPRKDADDLGKGESNSAQAFRDIIATLESRPDGDAIEPADEDSFNFRQSPSALSDDAASALRALVDDLASGGTRRVTPADSASDESSTTALEVEMPDEMVLSTASTDIDEAPLTPTFDAEEEAGAEIEPEAETEDTPEASTETPTDLEVENEQPADSMEDFDALLASLDAGGPPAATDTPAEPMALKVGEEPQAKSEAADDEISEDWDALLESVAKDNQNAEHSANASTPGRGSLAEAEQLMDVLTKQPTQADSAAAVAALPATGDAALGYDYSAVPSRRRSRRHSRLARRGWRMVKLALLFGVIVGAGGYLWWFVLAPLVEKPEDLEASATHLMASGRYTEASAAYLQLSRSSPADRAEARFRAAYALSLEQRDRGIDQTHSRYKQALALFEEFITENPQHPKYTRALCIMGRLYYELGEHEKAIAILRDQVKPVDDPAAALAMLRYLARAYKMEGAYEEAETSYLQAATLPGNYSAETDYLELGEMFRTRAALEEDAATRAKLEETADAYWNRGMQVPGIAPDRLDALKERLKWSAFAEESGDTAVSAPVQGNGAPTAPVPVPESIPEAAAVSPVPAPETGTGVGPDPALELQEMLQPGGASAESTPPATESTGE